MKKYRATAASEARVSYGIELCAGLRVFPETAPLAPAIEALNDELNTAYTKRRNLHKPMLEKRAVFRFAHYTTDQTIRMTHRAAEIADGGRKNGPIASYLFPDGLGPVVAPYGTRQIPPTEQLVANMKHCKIAGSEALCAEWLPKLETVLGQLKTTADDYKIASKAYSDAFRDEVALRSEHYQCVDRLMGLVRAAFPNDRTRQDLIFPVMEGGGDNVDGDGDGAGGAENDG